MAAEDLVRSERTGSSANTSLIVVCAAHWVSHFHFFVFPLLYPFLKERFGVGFVELGLGITLFNVLSALTQTPVGYLVDRFGPTKILITGMCIGGSAFILLGLTLSYPWYLVCAAIGGIANSVYHPSDYAILSATQDERRMGRAFSIHTFAGFLGGAVAPALMVFLVWMFDARGALIASGAIAIAVALAVVFVPVRESAAAAAKRKADGATSVKVLTPAILSLTLFFTFISLASAGISGFSIVVFMAGYGISFEQANIALTAYLAMSAVGVLFGGYLADRVRRHDLVATVSYTLNACVVLFVALTTLPVYILIPVMGCAGFLSGSITASRDMMVRKAAPAGAIGRAFGLVSTGFNFGGIIAPPMYGWIMDQNMPHWVLITTAICMLLTSATTVIADRVRRRSVEVAG